MEINHKCWKTGERKWETKRVDIDILKEKTVNNKREEIKSAITNKGRVKIYIIFNIDGMYKVKVLNTIM